MYILHDHIYDKTKKILEFETPLMLCPFGVENYNYKYVVNLEFFEKDKNNEMYNFYVNILSLDKFIQEKVRKKKQYLSCIKPRNKFNPLLRVYLKKHGRIIQTEFYKMNGDKKEMILMSDIKGHKCKAIIETGSIWENDNNYGIILILKEIIVY